MTGIEEPGAVFNIGLEGLIKGLRLRDVFGELAPMSWQ